MFVEFMCCFVWVNKLSFIFVLIIPSVFPFLILQKSKLVSKSKLVLVTPRNSKVKKKYIKGIKGVLEIFVQAM